MAEYIEKHKLRELYEDLDDDLKVPIAICKANIDNMPTIDIVWCKYCKYKVGENTEYNDAHCGIHERGNNRELTVGDYDYCSWGELKENENG